MAHHPTDVQQCSIPLSNTTTSAKIHHRHMTEAHRMPIIRMGYRHIIQESYPLSQVALVIPTTTMNDHLAVRARAVARHLQAEVALVNSVVWLAILAHSKMT